MTLIYLEEGICTVVNLNFGLYEKHTKFEKDSPHSPDLLGKRQNHEEDFFKLCAFLKKSQLYQLLTFQLNTHFRTVRFIT